MNVDNMMTYKGYLARVDYDAADEIFVGHLADIGDIVGFHSDTVTGLKAAFHQAVDDYAATCARMGKETEPPFSGAMTLRVAPEVYAKAARAAERKGKSMSQWGAEVLSAAAAAAVEE